VAVIVKFLMTNKVGKKVLMKTAKRLALGAAVLLTVSSAVVSVSAETTHTYAGKQLPVIRAYESAAEKAKANAALNAGKPVIYIDALGSEVYHNFTDKTFKGEETPVVIDETANVRKLLNGGKK
jgi:hypothetical protein